MTQLEIEKLELERTRKAAQAFPKISGTFRAAVDTAVKEMAAARGKASQVHKTRNYNELMQMCELCDTVQGILDGRAVELAQTLEARPKWEAEEAAREAELATLREFKQRWEEGEEAAQAKLRAEREEELREEAEELEELDKIQAGAFPRRKRFVKWSDRVEAAAKAAGLVMQRKGGMYCRICGDGMDPVKSAVKVTAADKCKGAEVWLYKRSAAAAKVVKARFEKAWRRKNDD